MLLWKSLLTILVSARILIKIKKWENHKIFFSETTWQKKILKMKYYRQLFTVIFSVLITWAHLSVHFNCILYILNFSWIHSFIHSFLLLFSVFIFAVHDINSRFLTSNKNDEYHFFWHTNHEYNSNSYRLHYVSFH